MRTASCILSLLLLLGPAAPLPAAEREGCSICGMYLDLYARTRLTLTLDNGSSLSSCSLACAVRIMDQHKGHVREIRVADFPTGDLIDARKAFFLENSDIPGVMSATSRIAFASRASARAFQKEHRGRIISFDLAVRRQREDQE